MQRIARIAAAIAFALGALGLAGWLLELPLLRKLHPDWRDMGPNTAAGLLVTSVSLFLLQAPTRRVRTRIGEGLALLALAPAIATVLRTAWPQVPAWLTLSASASASAPYAVGNALGTALVALGLLALAHERRHWFGLSTWLGLATIGFALLHLVSAALYSAPGITRMAVSNALGYLAMGVGLLCVRLDGHWPQLMARRELFGQLALPLFGTGLVMPILLYLLQVWWFVPSAPRLHDAALLLAAVLGIALFGVMTFALWRVDRLDLRRREAEGARDLLLARLQQQAANLEVLVSERTHELQKTTERLDLALRAGGFGVWD